MLLLCACSGRGIRSELVWGIEAFVPSLSVWRSLFCAADQAAKLAKMND